MTAGLSHGYFSPLRYPGGKGKLTPFISRLLRLNGLEDGTYVEPYAGGAAVALELLILGKVRRIHINDLNRSIHAFWRSVLDCPDELCRMIADTPVTISEWQRQRAVQWDDKAGTLELGFSTFFLNRTNRSGIVNRGGVIGGLAQTGEWKIDARFNKRDLISRIERIADYSTKITLHNVDAERLIKRLARSIAKKAFIYLDPPYYQKGQDLYLNYYCHNDHARLASTIAALPSHIRWMASYDNHPEIRALYSSFRQMTYSLSYSAAERYQGSEALIFADGLTIPAACQPMKKERFHEPELSELALL
ncbi:DNA adenine methylase [Caballeronia sp. SL2Y3]|uniref:DNA adenine methylase n=1 Tax=Caballeronia sp. SL2Y3 TaxID=2878151 RepID=UPI001FD5E36B|nr:DNA adenine methylase [Caballeronia sp. SL2Y3]